MEAALSVICEAFHCTPTEAKELDWREVTAILDYRLLAAAKAQHNVDTTKMTPGMTAIWTEMVKAAEED